MPQQIQPLAEVVRRFHAGELQVGERFAYDIRADWWMVVTAVGSGGFAARSVDGDVLSFAAKASDK
jgi:hypothetical protein